MPSDKQAPAARYENEPNSLSRKAAHSQSTVTPCASPPNGSLPNPGSCEAAGQAPATSELAAAAADSTRKEQQQAPVRDSSKVRVEKTGILGIACAEQVTCKHSVVASAIRSSATQTLLR